MTFTKEMILNDRDTGYSYVVKSVQDRTVTIATTGGRFHETVSHAVASIKYRAK